MNKVKLGKSGTIFLLTWSSAILFIMGIHNCHTYEWMLMPHSSFVRRQSF